MQWCLWFRGGMTRLDVNESTHFKSWDCSRQSRTFELTRSNLPRIGSLWKPSRTIFAARGFVPSEATKYLKFLNRSSCRAPKKPRQKHENLTNSYLWQLIGSTFVGGFILSVQTHEADSNLDDFGRLRRYSLSAQGGKQLIFQDVFKELPESAKSLFCNVS